MAQALSKTPLKQVPTVQHLLMNEGARDQLAMVAAKHLNPERMMRVMANAVRVTPKLAKCEPMSFLGALMQCASLGLEPNTILGQAYLIPFDNKKKGITEVQVVVGYKGLIDLARRSGHITSISANIHYSDDVMWLYEEGTEAQLRHQPGDQEGEKKHAYAIAQFRDGGHAYVVLPWKHILKIRDNSQGWKTAVRFNSTASSPWHTHEDEMAKKTAIRALAKYLPLSIEFSDAMQMDEKAANYGAFAMDPTQGVTIDGEAEEGHDPDTGEVYDAQPEQIEQQRQVDPAPAQQRTADPAPRTRQRGEPRADVTYADPAPAQQRQATQEPERETQQQDNVPDRAAFQSLYETISGNILDGASRSDILDMFGDQIEAMKTHAPDLHKKVETELADAA